MNKRILRIILWVGTIVMMVVLFQLSSPLRDAGVSSVEEYEMADKAEAAAIVASWEKHTLIHVVFRVIYFDYLFILFYVPLIIMSSRDQLQLEKNNIMRLLLTLNTPLAILTGALDVTENLIMVHNVCSIADHICVRGVSIIKFSAAGLAILIWLFAIVRRKVVG